MKKTALITGASCGLGLSFANVFAREGYDLVLVARNGERLEEIKSEIEEKYGVKATVIAKDLCELQGGRLGLQIDGDLFKAVVALPIT